MALLGVLCDIYNISDRSGLCAWSDHQISHQRHPPDRLHPRRVLHRLLHLLSLHTPKCTKCSHRYIGSYSRTDRLRNKDQKWFFWLVLQMRRYISWDVGFFWSFFFVSMFLVLLNVFFIRSNALSILIAVVFSAIYAFYLIIDTQLIMGNRNRALSLDNYILGAVLLYIDIIQLFLNLLRILGDRNWTINHDLIILNKYKTI